VLLVDVATLVQQVINGIALGGVYALVAVSFTLVFGTLQIINLAQGALIAVGGFLAYLAVTSLGWSLVPIAALAVIVGGIVNVILNVIAFRPLRRSARPDTQFSSLVASLAVLFILQGVLRIASEARALPLPGSIVSDEMVTLGPIDVPSFRLVMVVVTFAVAGALFAFLRLTARGRAMRTVGWRVEVARVLGIPAERLINLGFAVAGGLAALAGVLIAAAFNFVTFSMGNPYLLKGLAAIILGGLGSVPGAIVGGLFIGVSESLAIQFVAGQWRDAIAFGILMIVLVIRPTGLLGRRDTAQVL
jgi:branched-chain amino acid transport system permease protein